MISWVQSSGLLDVSVQEGFSGWSLGFKLYPDPTSTQPFSVLFPFDFGSYSRKLSFLESG